MTTDTLRSETFPSLSTEVTSRPVAIIDLGSNTVRLVVFEGAARNPLTIFNEKVSARLGQNVASTGKLDAEGIARAVVALSRFHAVIEGLKVDVVHIIATAAVREASNGADFVDHVQKTFGVPVEILSGKEEARLAALGVLSGIPDAEGLAGDLGGGSLELITLKDKDLGTGITLPIGALRLMDMSGGKISKARKIVREALERVDWLESSSGSFYAVGGAWRALGRIHMDQTNYPFRVLQNYEIAPDEARDLARWISKQRSADLSKMSNVPSHRVDSLPFSAVVLETLLEFVPADKVVVSCMGVREGLLFDGLPDPLKRSDPLMRSCRGMASRLSRSFALAEELIDFTQTLFASLETEETPQQRRLREAACWLSDIAWRAHPDHRGSNAFREVLYGAVFGLNHSERLRLGMAVYHRYESGSIPTAADYNHIVSDEDERWARVLGLSIRLGTKISSGILGILPSAYLTVEQQTLVLNLPKSYKALVGDILLIRLDSVAKRLKLQSGLKYIA